MYVFGTLERKYNHTWLLQLFMYDLLSVVIYISLNGTLATLDYTYCNSKRATAEPKITVSFYSKTRPKQQGKEERAEGKKKKQLMKSFSLIFFTSVDVSLSLNLHYLSVMFLYHFKIIHSMSFFFFFASFPFVFLRLFLFTDNQTS